MILTAGSQCLATLTQMAPDLPEPAPDADDAASDDDRFAVVERREWLDGHALAPAPDLVAREEPLEIRVNHTALAVVMRTPGDDHELVRGFLLSERIVDDAGQIADIRHCTTIDTPEAEDNVVLVRLAPEASVDLASMRRNLYASSSCGVCGKASIEAAMAIAKPRTDARAPRQDPLRVPASLVARLPARLRRGQVVFERTGGLHAAGLFDGGGALMALREDVGRHNAVDKVCGWAASAGVELGACVLVVSGRVSFEIVQKAVALGVPFIAAVSAPTSLAVELARDAGLTLVGFVRDGRLCVYAGAQRIT